MIRPGTRRSSASRPGWLSRLLGALVRRLAPPLVRRVWRVRVRGGGRVPPGGALLVANHLSYLDAPLIAAALDRPVRFLMWRPLFRLPLVGGVASAAGAIPIAAEDPPKEQRRSLEQAAAAAAAGELVCVFAEGRMSRDGRVLPFRRGLERIARRARVPIVPVAIAGTEETAFAPRQARRPHRSGRPGLDVCFGEPLPAHTPAWCVRDAVGEALARLARERAREGETLTTALVRGLRRKPRRTALIDVWGALHSRRRTLASALALAERLRVEAAGCERVALLLPGGPAASISLAAILLAGKTAVPLSPLFDDRELASLVRRSRASVVLSSRRLPRALPGCRDLEDLAEQISPFARLRAWLATFLPAGLLARRLGVAGDARAPALILFSSGSTARPKAVVLSHAAVLANLRAAARLFGLRPDDRLLAPLPVFHAFGATAGVFLPLIEGIAALQHHNPLEAAAIARLAREGRATVIIGTPTLFRLWSKRIPPGGLSALRLGVAGGEALPRSLAREFRDRFGAPLVEGYGATELAPIVAVDLDAAHLAEPREGVGSPLPGVWVRVADPATGAPLPPGRDGSVLVFGAGVMEGYDGEPERTAAVLRDGAYTTGDIGHLTSDGRLVLTGRAERFSKVGGEMVPHGRVELAIAEAAWALARERGLVGAAPEVLVFAVADEHKGERLVVLACSLAVSPASAIARAIDDGLPPLFAPHPGDLHQVCALPRTPSGKVDLAAARALALKLDAAARGGAVAGQEAAPPYSKDDSRASASF